MVTWDSYRFASTDHGINVFWQPVFTERAYTQYPFAFEIQMRHRRRHKRRPSNHLGRFNAYKVEPGKKTRQTSGLPTHEQFTSCELRNVFVNKKGLLTTSETMFAKLTPNSKSNKGLTLKERLTILCWLKEKPNSSVKGRITISHAFLCHVFSTVR